MKNKVAYGIVNEHGIATPLTEEKMISFSLESLEDYEQSGHSISQETMEQWANSLGTDNQLSCPQ